jgi:hypothetical protein
MKLKVVKFSFYGFLKSCVSTPYFKWNDIFALLPFWLRGFVTEHIRLYGLNENNHKLFLNDACKHRVTLFTNVKVWPVLHDKLFFDRFFSNKLPVVPMISFVVNGVNQGDNPGFSEILSNLSVENGLVIKPLQGGMGDGIIFVKRTDDGYLLNGEIVHEKLIIDQMNSLEYHGIYPLIKQHRFISEIYDKTINTLRITSYIQKNGTPKIFGAVLRVGSEKTIPVDNFSQGGITVDVDLQTGITHQAKYRDSEGKCITIDHHPNTNHKLSNLTIPYWDDIKKCILEFHQDYPAFDLVGWDIIVTDDGFYFIEGNHNPNIRQTFIHRNFSTDPSFREFFISKGIIK